MITLTEKNVITFDDGTLMGFIDCIPEPNA